MELRINESVGKIPVMTKEQLKTFREELGLSQDELAKELRVARNTVSRWELGNAKIPEFLDLALRTIKRDLKKKSMIESALLEASKDGSLVTEDKIINALSKVGYFNDNLEPDTLKIYLSDKIEIKTQN